MTTVMSSPFAGAEMMTFLAPATRCPLALSASVNRPVDSMTISTPSAFQGSSAGVLAETTRISAPFTIRTSSSALSGEDLVELTVPAKRPWVESYLSRYAKLSAGTMSPTATTLMSLPTNPCSTRARKTKRPIRPKPLIATLTAIVFVFVNQFTLPKLGNLSGVSGRSTGISHTRCRGSLSYQEGWCDPI